MDQINQANQANTVPRPARVGGEFSILSRQAASDNKRGSQGGALTGEGDGLDFPMQFHYPDEDWDDCSTGR